MIINYGCAKLRAIEKEDFELLFHLINASEIEDMTGGWCFPVSRMAQKHWIETFQNSNENVKLMIELTNHKTIGMIMLTGIDWKNRHALLEYKMSAPVEDRIKGDMLDAVTGMLKYAFEELGLHCITAVILEENKFSLKLCKRAGFTKEGILRDRVYKKGTYKNQIVLSLLKDEFYKREK